MKKLAIRIGLSTGSAFAVYWLYKFGVFMGALTTQRTQFYFQMHSVLIWVVVGITALCVFLQTERAA